MTIENEEEAARAKALQRLRTKGLEVAIEALIDVAQNKQAPANSRAQAGSALVRANGLYAAGPQGQPKELHELTAAELKALGDQLERDRRALLAQIEDDGSVFG